MMRAVKRSIAGSSRSRPPRSIASRSRISLISSSAKPTRFPRRISSIRARSAAD
jgi:hypothetical protein